MILVSRETGNCICGIGVGKFCCSDRTAAALGYKDLDVGIGRLYGSSSSQGVAKSYIGDVGVCVNNKVFHK